MANESGAEKLKQIFQNIINVMKKNLNVQGSLHPSEFAEKLEEVTREATQSTVAGDNYFYQDPEDGKIYFRLKYNSGMLKGGLSFEETIDNYNENARPKTDKDGIITQDPWHLLGKQTLTLIKPGNNYEIIAKPGDFVTGEISMPPMPAGELDLTKNGAISMNGDGTIQVRLIKGDNFSDGYIEMKDQVTTIEKSVGEKHIIGGGTIELNQREQTVVKGQMWTVGDINAKIPNYYKRCNIFSGQIQSLLNKNIKEHGIMSLSDSNKNTIQYYYIKINVEFKPTSIMVCSNPNNGNKDIGLHRAVWNLDLSHAQGDINDFTIFDGGNYHVFSSGNLTLNESIKLNDVTENGGDIIIPYTVASSTNEPKTTNIYVTIVGED